MKPRKSTNSERVPRMTFWYSFLCEAKHCSVSDPCHVAAPMDIHTGIFFLLLWFGVLLLSVFLQVAALQANVSLRCPPLLFLCQWITSQHCNILLLKTKNSEHADRFLAILEHYLATGGKDEPQGWWWRVDALFPNCLQFGWHATSLVLSRLLSSFPFFTSQEWFWSPSLSTHWSTVFCFCAVCMWDDRKR